MFYPKRLKNKKTKLIKMKLNNFLNGIDAEIDENSLKDGQSKVIYNLKYSNGALKTGLGFEDLSLPTSKDSDEERQFEFIVVPQEIHKVWVFPFYNNMNLRKEYMLMIYADDIIYFFHILHESPYIYRAIHDFHFTSIPNAIFFHLDGEDVMLLTSSTDGMVIYHPYLMHKIDSEAPKISSLCKHYGRIFAIIEGKRTQLVISENPDPSKWEEEAEIDFTDEFGSLVKVVSFNDNVYVFKEFGIWRVTDYTSTFSISNMFLSSGRIYGNTVCVCGDNIIFLTSDGLYSFNGYSVTKFDLNIEKYLKNINIEKCCSTYYNDKYYLSLKIKFEDDEKIGCEKEEFINNALLELDLHTNCVQIVRGVDIRCLCPIEYENAKRLVAVLNGKYNLRLAQLTEKGKLFDEDLPKLWISGYTNLGYPDCNKMIKKLNIISKYPCKFKIKTEKEEKIFELKGLNKTETIYPLIYGEMFEFSISSDGETDISNFEIEFTVSE